MTIAASIRTSMSWTHTEIDMAKKDEPTPEQLLEAAKIVTDLYQGETDRMVEALEAYGKPRITRNAATRVWTVRFMGLSGTSLTSQRMAMINWANKARRTAKDAAVKK